MNSKRKLIIIALIAAAILSITLLANAEPSDENLEYIPTKMTVTGTTVKIQGYFVNHNGFPVGDLEDFHLYIYENGELIADAYFGDLGYFEVDANGRYTFNFTIKDVHGRKRGSYNCGLYDITADFECTYSYWK